MLLSGTDDMFQRDCSTITSIQSPPTDVSARKSNKRRRTPNNQADTDDVLNRLKKLHKSVMEDEERTIGSLDDEPQETKTSYSRQATTGTATSGVDGMKAGGHFARLQQALDNKNKTDNMTISQPTAFRCVEM